MISGNLNIIDLLAGITQQPETVPLPGFSDSVENTDQDFAGIFAHVVNSVNGLVAQASDLSLPVTENSIESEIVQSLILEPTTDQTATANNAELFVLPKSKFLVNVEPVDILNQGNTKLPDSPKSKYLVNNETVEILNQNIPVLPDSPKSKYLVNNETVDIFNRSNADLPVGTFKSPHQALDFHNSIRPEGKVQSSTTKAPVITIDGMAVSGVVKPPESPPPLFANDDMARLNLKEVHIKHEKTIESPIELVKNYIPIQSFATKAEVEKNDAAATHKSPAAKAEPVRIIIENGHEAEPESDHSKNYSQAPVELKTEESELLSAKIKSSDKFETVLTNEKSPVPANIEQNANIDSKIWTQTEPGEPASDVKLNHSVKIVLPEQTKISGDNRNHSIMIRIEPEHLGPARLDLHLKNEVLTARLTVETAAAKTTLENSINTLKEQFARADIRVEQIEINVRGESNYNQSFARQSQWQKFNSAHQPGFNSGDLLEPFVPASQISNFRQYQYVGSGGVNILA